MLERFRKTLSHLLKGTLGIGIVIGAMVFFIPKLQTAVNKYTDISLIKIGARFKTLHLQNFHILSDENMLKIIEKAYMNAVEAPEESIAAQVQQYLSPTLCVLHPDIKKQAAVSSAQKSAFDSEPAEDLFTDESSILASAPKEDSDPGSDPFTDLDPQDNKQSDDLSLNDVYSNLDNQNINTEAQNINSLDQPVDYIYCKTKNKFNKNVELRRAIQQYDKSIFAINIHQMRQNLLDTGYFKEIIVRRNLPSTLQISVIEKAPIALWHYEDKILLVSADGDILGSYQSLAAYNIDPDKDLIHVHGINANLYAKKLSSCLNQSIKANMTFADYVENRRWDLVYKDGLVIMLPESPSEELLNALGRFNLNRPSNIIRVDARTPGKIYLKYRDNAKPSNL